MIDTVWKSPMKSKFDNSNNQKRTNLVVVRLGDDFSLHREWLENQKNNRSWDLMISYYGKNPENVDLQESEYFDHRTGQKWPAIGEIYREGFFQDYSMVWFPDNDIKTTCENINLMFALHKIFDLELSQPALTENSYISHDITRVCSDSVLRYTNFVEIMVPLFSKNALEKCAESFSAPGMAWGLDYVWPKLLDNPLRKIAILDCLAVCHTRPQGNGYDMNVALQGKHNLMQKYGVNDTMMVFEKIKKE